MWLIGTMVCSLAAPWVQSSVIAGSGWPHNALRHHWLMPISCHFRDCKVLLVTILTPVSGAIISVQTFTFTYLNRVKYAYTLDSLRNWNTLFVVYTYIRLIPVDQIWCKLGFGDAPETWNAGTNKTAPRFTMLSSCRKLHVANRSQDDSLRS